MKTIIHATDYSNNAVAALKYAHLISTKLKANLLVLHIFDIPTIMSTELKEPYYYLETDTFKMHHTKLEKFCIAHLGKELDKMNVRVEAVEDKSVVNGIISKAVELDASMIITGMKGGSKFKELIMGNTVKHLLEKSLCPVLSIPADVSNEQIETIVYATDFEEEDINVIETITEIAKAFDAEIRIVHISPLKEFDRKKLMKDFEEKAKERINYSKMEFDIIPSDDTFEELRLYLGEVNADIIVMLERKSKGLLKRLFHRDIVKKMESYGRIPLMSFNETNYLQFKF